MCSMNQSNHEIRRMIYTTEKPGATELHHGDCLKLMPSIPDGSVDMILADLPYGVTQNKWDVPIPMQPLWDQYRRIVKPNGAIVLTATQPFASALITAAADLFRYDLVWEKSRITGFLNSNRMPLRAHELVLVFYKNLPTYNPQRIKLNSPSFKSKGSANRLTTSYGDFDPTVSTGSPDGTGFPRSIFNVRYEPDFFDSSVGGSRMTHPTQKPASLMEYLIRTYTNEGETVLDNCMGSGTTGVAAVRCGRRFIGIEMDARYFEAAKSRIQEEEARAISMIQFTPTY